MKTEAQGAPWGDFADLIREHQNMVYSIAWHFLRDGAAAEELAQEVFLQFYRHRDSIESPAHAVNWLRKVATQRSIDESRRRRFRPISGLDAAPEPAGVPAVRDPLLGGMLQKLVAQLPERARAIVLLRYQEDLDPTEIAELLGVPVGTVKSSLHRALAVLRSRLERAVEPASKVSRTPWSAGDPPAAQTSAGDPAVAQVSAGDPPVAQMRKLCL